MKELAEAADLNRRAASAGVELRFGRHDVLDDLEPLWLSMLDHHVEIGAAGLPVVSRDLSWSRRRSFYAGLLSEPEATIAARGVSSARSANRVA